MGATPAVAEKNFDFSKNSDTELLALERTYRQEANNHEEILKHWLWMEAEARRQVGFAEQVIADHDHAAALARAESRRRMEAAIADGWKKLQASHAGVFCVGEWAHKGHGGGAG